MKEDKRVIKFRVIFKNKIDGYEILTSAGWEWMALGLNHDKGERWSHGVYPYGGKYIRNQFTGLLDRNKKEAYHKDLLKGFKGKLWVIEWQDEEARFLIMASTGNSDQWKFMDEVSDMEIIGNVFSNPELLTPTTSKT